MNKFQTGIKQLERKSKDSPWVVTVEVPATGETKNLSLSLALSEAGPRLKEVLNRIDKQDVYPRRISGVELQRLGMDSADSLVVRMVGEKVVSMEASFRLMREYAGKEAINADFSASMITHSDGGGSFNTGTRVVGERIGEYTEKESAGNPVKDGAERTVHGQEERSNLLDFVKPLDDRVDELFPDGVDDKVRIGDVMLTIPPLNISLHKASNIEKVKTLRSKSSMMINTGNSNQVLNMTLYFHDLDNINGHKVRMHPDKDRYYYMDGLRSLIAQFKKAPFVPIDNEYINETLDIHSVALVGMNVETVPGFPHSISVSMSLMEFEHEAYMPQLTHLGAGMNYPLFRWYYQEALRDDVPKSSRSPYRTWLDPIPESTGLTNEFTFRMVREAVLAEREDAIDAISHMTEPRLALSRFNNPESNVGPADDENRMLGKAYQDALGAQKALEAYNAMESGDFSHPALDNEADSTYASLSNQFRLKLIDPANIRLLPFEGSEGYIDNPGLFSPAFQRNDRYAINVRDIHVLEQIIERGIDAEDAFISNADAYEQAQKTIEKTEGELPMDDFPIGGDLIPINVSVMYENQFSTAQLQAMEVPTLQFLGGQDPYVQVTFEADELGVEDLREMMRETERYAKEYRRGITSGFLGIDNHLLQLFGVRTIMPETMTINTKPGFPGKFVVEMTLVGFNKTQKRMEQLEGMSSIYGDAPDRSARDISNFDKRADDAIIQAKMQDLELYPDLELPLLSEVAEALPYIGASIDAYTPDMTGTYVDPDFYMATEETFREIVKEERYKNQRSDLKDSMGISAWTESQSGDAYDMDDENWAAFSALDSTVQQAKADYSWDSQSIGSQMGDGPVSYPDAGAADYIHGLFGGTAQSVTGPGSSVSPFSGWPITSPYGPRSLDGFHYGVDYGGALGTPIITPHGGEVLSAEWSTQGGGNQVVLYNPNFNKTFIFMHMSGNLPVRRGQVINPGTKVGEMNTTGNSTGVHLHYQVNEGRGYIDNYGYAISPMNWLQTKEGSFMNAGNSAVARGTNSSVIASQNGGAHGAQLAQGNRRIGTGGGEGSGSTDGWKKEKKGRNVKNPKPHEVYKEIYKWIDSVFLPKGYWYNDKDTAKNTEGWQSVAYAIPQDLRAMQANYLQKNNIKNIKKKDNKEEFVNAGKGTFKNTDNKVPRERVANIIKALFEMSSGWQQFEGSGKPKIDSRLNTVGISGIPLEHSATSKERAEALIWNWKFNVELAVKRLYDGWVKAYNAGGQKAIRPWDYMILYYITGSIDGEIAHEYVHRVESTLNKYNSYANIHRTPRSSMDPKVVGAAHDLNEIESDAANGDKAGMIQTLVDMGYREVKTDKNWFLNRLAWANEDWKDEMHTKEETINILEGMTQKEVKKIYDDKLKEDTVSVQAHGHWIPSDHDEASQKAVALSKAETDIDEHADRKLTEMNQPNEAFPEMMHDVVHYDQKMRLVRAFPTFQMFIVDEGQWISTYRLWDNLYGFNAIQSIDVHKSRKIAADTAIIKMTNVYSNLTSRREDASYEEWDYKFWDNFIWGNPSQEIIDGRNDLLNGMMLEAGARIHLRMGYGSSANDLPVMFNGVITEMNAEEVITLVCQGDGVELGSAISGDPDENTKTILKDPEPRAILCDLLTSKGNWMKDVLNEQTGGRLFQENPLGIVHFGNPTPQGPAATWQFFNTDYGEAAQNIYSSNGLGTFSQWVMPDGSPIKRNWLEFDMTRWAQPGDEDNVAVRLYNNSFWDVAQTLAYCSPDYIAAVHPFEMRSTFFFGKPYWGLAHAYENEYTYEEDTGDWVRHAREEYRKPYSQLHFFDSNMDIISNGIKASAEGIYTNAIVTYDGKQTPVIYADRDIYAQAQRTTVVEAEIVSNMIGVNYWTAEKQAEYFGASTVRDYMKDMYKGEMVVLGDPTLKPHDMCYMNDSLYNMHGTFLVGAVTHQFSHDTGFISSVKPDANVVNDDLAMISLADWATTIGVALAAKVVGVKIARRAMKKMLLSNVSAKMLAKGGRVAKKANYKSMRVVAKSLDLADPDMRDVKNMLDGLSRTNLSSRDGRAKIRELKTKVEALDAKVKADGANGKYGNNRGLQSYKRYRGTTMMLSAQADGLLNGRNAMQGMKHAGKIRTAMSLTKFSLPSIFISVATSGLIEKYRRKKANSQAVLMMPLTYHSRNYTAGITGHAGMVVGDSMGKYDMLYSGMGTSIGDSDGIIDTLAELGFSAANLLSGDNTEFTTHHYDIQGGN